MKILISGASGTVGQPLCKQLQAAGHELVSYDRKEAGLSDYANMEAWLKKVDPDVFFHLAVASRETGLNNEPWLVNYEWPSELAWICKQLDIEFIFTSSVTVFTEDRDGPYTIATPADEKHGYGFEKRKAEERVIYQNPQARVVRLGWQIGEVPGGNQMVTWLENAQQQDGVIRVSKNWLPSCSFLEDTAAALIRIMSRPPGLYQINSNLGWTFLEIAEALKDTYGFDHWNLEPEPGMNWDQRMLDERPKVPPLSKRLKSLRKIIDFHHTTSGF